MARVPLLGGAYQMRSLIAGAQRSVNLFSENNPGEAQSPVPVTTYPTPGLRFLGRPSDQPGTPDPVPVPPIPVPIPAVTFGGATDLLLTSNLTGVADSPFALFSTWIIPALPITSLAGNYYLAVTGDIGTGGEIFSVGMTDQLNGTVIISIDANTGPLGAASIFWNSDPIPYASFSGWTNVLVAVDTNHAAGARVAKLYVNDAPIALTAVAEVGGAFSMPFATTDGETTGLFNFSPGGNFNFALHGDAAETWYGPAQFLDLTVSGNRRQFITAGGKAVLIGGDGSSATGTAPAGYFSGAPSTFGVNAGTGGAFSINGAALTDAATDPY